MFWANLWMLAPCTTLYHQISSNIWWKLKIFANPCECWPLSAALCLSVCLSKERWRVDIWWKLWIFENYRYFIFDENICKSLWMLAPVCNLVSVCLSKQERGGEVPKPTSHCDPIASTTKNIIIIIFFNERMMMCKIWQESVNLHTVYNFTHSV